jgi:hypothetical protein
VDRRHVKSKESKIPGGSLPPQTADKCNHNRSRGGLPGKSASSLFPHEPKITAWNHLGYWQQTCENLLQRIVRNVDWPVSLASAFFSPCHYLTTLTRWARQLPAVIVRFGLLSRKGNGWTVFTGHGSQHCLPLILRSPNEISRN